MPTSDTDDPDSIRECYHIYGGKTTRGTSELTRRLAKILRTPSDSVLASSQKRSHDIEFTCWLVLGATPTLSRAYSKRAPYRIARYKTEDPVILRCHICLLSSLKHNRLSQVKRAVTSNRSKHTGTRTFGKIMGCAPRPEMTEALSALQCEE